MTKMRMELRGVCQFDLDSAITMEVVWMMLIFLNVLASQDLQESNVWSV